MADSLNIQWFPGHMTKTRRMIEANLKQVDAVMEIVDARIPVSSRNPLIDELTKGKKRLIVLNKCDLSQPEGNRLWSDYFSARGYAVLQLNALSGKGVSAIAPALRRLLQDKIERDAQRGMNKPLRVMVLGIPNVGKSSLINRLAKAAKTRVADRPGVTRGKQWVNVDGGLLLLDTPGILWPKFDDPEVGMRLAYTGAVKDDILDTETLGCHLMELLAREYPQALTERYKIDIPEEIDGWELLQAAGRKRGFLVSRGEVDTERMARVLLDEYRSCKLGTFTLERPEELQ